ncbi:MAG: HAD hydrolase family protein, partial [Colwellia sp.]|nr:HAD hydrolase family protein [Colwellia sp.]
GLTRQDVPQERRCSYFCEEGAVTEELSEIAATLNCDVLYSAGLYLDFLPKGINKGATLTALINHLELNSEDVMVAGDTLNDLSMYEHDFIGVCVGESEAGLLGATRSVSSIDI